MIILDGNEKGDKDEKFPYIGPRVSSRLYCSNKQAIVNIDAQGEVQKMIVDMKIDLDHPPLIIYLMKITGKEGRVNELKRIAIWMQEAITECRQKKNY